MGVTARFVQKLRARFKNPLKENIVFPATMGRPRRGAPARSEQSVVLAACRALKSKASQMWNCSGR